MKTTLVKIIASIAVVISSCTGFYILINDNLNNYDLSFSETTGNTALFSDKKQVQSALPVYKGTQSSVANNFSGTAQLPAIAAEPKKTVYQPISSATVGLGDTNFSGKNVYTDKRNTSIASGSTASVSSLHLYAANSSVRSNSSESASNLGLYARLNRNSTNDMTTYDATTHPSTTSPNNIGNDTLGERMPIGNGIKILLCMLAVFALTKRKKQTQSI